MRTTTPPTGPDGELAAHAKCGWEIWRQERGHSANEVEGNVIPIYIVVGKYTNIPDLLYCGRIG